MNCRERRVKAAQRRGKACYVAGRQVPETDGDARQGGPTHKSDQLPHHDRLVGCVGQHLVDQMAVEVRARVICHADPAGDVVARHEGRHP